MSVEHKLRVLHEALDNCRACSTVIGPVVHGPPVVSPVLIVGQAPGPREGKIGRPFAWTAGKTLFKWFEQATGQTEERVRERIYFSAVARCFPGKAKSGGDRKPDPTEIANCRPFLEKETTLLKPLLVVPVGTLAIEQVLTHKGPLAPVIGKRFQTTYHGHLTDVICLPHPSGASTWHRVSPGKELLLKALDLIAAHPAIQQAFTC
ncbi:MAG: uracil-DNA glycosylase family protein [Polyangiaceae bacterium]|nr:uracil-DNA glycosylase family protein [Polyangiaceae bacterium]